MLRRPPISTRTDALCPYTSLFRSLHGIATGGVRPDLTLVLTLGAEESARRAAARDGGRPDRFGARDAAFHRRIDAALQARLKGEPVRCRQVAAAGSAEDRKNVV